MSIDISIIRGEWKISGVVHELGNCDRCGKEISARTFEVTHKTTGAKLNLGRRCTARATGYPIGRVEQLAAVERRIAEVRRREGVALAAFPAMAPIFEAAQTPGGAWPPPAFFVFQTATTEDMFWEGGRREGGWHDYLVECLPAHLRPAVTAAA